MKTKKLRAKGRKQAAPPPLTDSQIAILLSGYRAPFDPNADRDARSEAARLAADANGLRTAAALWDQHETFLRKEAERLGRKPEFGRRGKLFWAESFSHNLREHATRQGAA